MMNHRMGMLQMILFCMGGVVLALLALGLGFGAVAPFLLFGGCALMMLMMMRGMHGGGHDDGHGHGHDSGDKPA